MKQNYKEPEIEAQVFISKDGLLYNSPSVNNPDSYIQDDSDNGFFGGLN